MNLGNISGLTYLPWKQYIIIMIVSFGVIAFYKIKLSKQYPKIFSTGIYLLWIGGLFSCFHEITLQLKTLEGLAGITQYITYGFALVGMALLLVVAYKRNKEKAMEEKNK